VNKDFNQICGPQIYQRLVQAYALHVYEWYELD